ncbi:hypothetical protein F4801DRAFT_101356 [Xylaria longipes]|nr:hypothetical protein F4801DRAFT_101356 [Xylaria longipes]
MIVQSKRKPRPNMANQEPFSHNGCHHEVHTGPAAELPEPDRIGVFPKYELPTPTPTGVISRQELPVEQTLLNTTHAAQDHSVDYHKDLQGSIGCEHPIVYGELEASNHRGELEADVRIAELSGTERRG